MHVHVAMWGWALAAVGVTGFLLGCFFRVPALVAASSSARICEAHEGLISETLLLLHGVRAHYPAGSLAAEHREYLREIQPGDGALVRVHLAHTTALIRASRDVT